MAAALAWAALAPPVEAGEETLCSRLRLAEVAAASGLDFEHDSGQTAARHLPESMGAGAVWLDFDGDGWLDLYLVQSGEFPPTASPRSANRLYRSLGGRGFVDVTESSGAGDRGYGQGAVAGDLDGDGDIDLVVTNFGPDVVLINQGDGRFESRALPNSSQWSASAALADLEGDGDLDLYVTSYVTYDPISSPRCFDESGLHPRYCDPSIFRGAADRLYLNDGVGGLSDASDRLPPEAVGGRGLGVLAVDLDGDLAPEIYVANDLTPNGLLHNDGRGGLADASLISGTAVNRQGRSEAGMGVAVIDLGADLDPDLVVTNFDVETNTLYENLGGMTFDDVSAASGLGPPSLNFLGFGLVALDLDLDGAQDLWVANGHIFDRPSRDNTGYAQASQLLLRREGRFVAADCVADWRQPLVARGAAAADYDNDGDVDLVLQQNGRAVRLVANRAVGVPYIAVDVALASPGSDAVGAVVTLETTRSSRRQWVIAGDSYLSASDRRRHFALAADEAPISLDVAWRSGRRLRLVEPPVGSFLRFAEPTQ